ncbi:ergosterol biosynthesis protein [Puccinia graminis f. sp. tritici]|uniref:Ergosterol biosynthesis protein n=1 Tax=Puccinia graminis f. sp. tritici TaxID=56615 RepID=A0A5B0PC44_PUCGR|nr:ergosterol biosynthesis protein [Puccinia graminis f. sp. tritici]
MCPGSSRGCPSPFEIQVSDAPGWNLQASLGGPSYSRSKLQYISMARDIVIPILAGLPPHPGWLPKWMMLIAGVSILNGLQNYISLAGARKVYDRRPDRVTGLQSRNFGTWTITAGLVRLYAAYNISNPGFCLMFLY